MAVLDVTPGGAASNSYCSLAEANAYAETVLRSSAWVTLEADQTKALIQATRLLDLYVDWVGMPSTTTQALRWPRLGVPLREGGVVDLSLGGLGLFMDSTTIPQWLKEATAELARKLLESDRTGDAQEAGLTSLSVSGLSMTFASSTMGAGLIPESVRAMVAPYGRIQQRGAIGVAHLLRV